ncbi:MAG: redoxin domain-containing protein [candidate division WOR-3 bacterium]|jgi:peroxiredoxin/SAM-dependent methyltransferase
MTSDINASYRSQINLDAYDTFSRFMFYESYKVYATLAKQIAEDYDIADDSVLELAFVAPYVSIELAKLTNASFDIIVEDSVELEVCEQRIEESGLLSRFTLHLGRSDSLPFRDESFDLVLARDAMRFWHDDPAVFSEINRVLKKGAFAFLGGGLGRQFSGAEAERIWNMVQDWRNRTDHIPWATTLPFPENIETALMAAGVGNYEVLTEGHCTCRTWVAWSKETPGRSVTYDMSYVKSMQDLRQDIGKPATDFTLRDVRGNLVKLSDLRGEVVVLDFWSVYCRSCLRLMKHLEPIRERFENKGCRFLTVNIDDELATLEDFLNGNSIAYPVLYDDCGVVRAYKIRGIPHFVMIDRDGVIVSRFIGGTDATIKQIESELMRLTAE